MAARRDSERSKLLVLVAVALLALLALLRWDLTGRAAQPGESPALSAVPANAADAASADRALGGQSAKSPSCAARASKACHTGDVWWFDACGKPEARAEDCERRGCDGFSCARNQPAEHACGEITAFGSCYAGVASACVANHLVSVDCGQRGERCVLTREGASCLPRDPDHGCGNGDHAACSGDRLRLCVDGIWTEIDCAARQAQCQSTDSEPRCVALDATLPTTPAPSAEACDGRDNDQDGRVDEAGACDTVQLVAFIPETARLIDLDARMRDELATLNRVFAPLVFEWTRRVEVESSYRTFAPKDMERTALALSQVESQAFAARLRTAAPAANEVKPGLSFYIPVLFVEKLRIDPPKAGISTLPNARCGGVRIADEPSPAHGLIVLSEVRSRETLTHELGHYLGLCHTHEELSQFSVANTTQLYCQRSGDGICDTLPDPGPSRCHIEGACELSCGSTSATPDASNIMSYYIACRRALTAEQIAEAERNLGLRRGWFRCLDPRDCPCQPAVANACPPEMSCHPGADDSTPWSCELDGPWLPGAICRSASQCALGAICVAQNGANGRCARPCRDADACSCSDVGLPFRVCAEDLK